MIRGTQTDEAESQLHGVPACVAQLDCSLIDEHGVAHSDPVHSHATPAITPHVSEVDASSQLVGRVRHCDADDDHVQLMAGL
jgi:hypothetical protein